LYKEQSRRDDLESLGYLLVYFCRGSLPWQGLKGATRKQKYDMISHRKMSIPLETLCFSMPTEFMIYLDYARKLNFDARPDYTFLRNLFKRVLLGKGYDFDLKFDWS
jgi:hypothetical protein